MKKILLPSSILIQGRPWSVGWSRLFTPPQVFISVDDLEPPGPQDPEDSRPKQEQEPATGTPGMAEQQSVEFDSPDSGLPSSRNYSVASGIQSSLDEAQSVGFEEDGGGEEGSSEGPTTAAHTVSEPHEPGQKLAPASELEAGEELAAVCAAAYTVRGCSLVLPRTTVSGSRSPDTLKPDCKGGVGGVAISKGLFEHH